MVPSLVTLRAISRTSPPVEEILPRFLTSASVSPLNSRVPPAMKASLAMSSVLAVKLPPVTTTPLDPTTTPAGLMTYSVPVAFSVPRMVDRLPPVTRFSVAPLPLLKLTVPPWPMEKLFQSMMARWLPWLTVRLPGPPLILPDPAWKAPPVGRVGPLPAWAGPTVVTASRAMAVPASKAARQPSREVSGEMITWPSARATPPCGAFPRIPVPTREPMLSAPGTCGLKPVAYRTHEGAMRATVLPRPSTPRHRSRPGSRIRRQSRNRSAGD
nr:hypothetical protein [Nitrospirillum amazonense]